MITHETGSAHELDLHEQTWHEARQDFIEFYNDWLRGAGVGPAAAIDVIHGYGSSGAGGVLRKRLRIFLAEQALQGRLEFIPGERVDANLGHTVVRPIAPLPVAFDLLAGEILIYCARPRTLSKITGKFRRHGEPAVKAAIDSLVRQRRLRAVGKNSRKTYEAI